MTSKRSRRPRSATGCGYAQRPSSTASPRTASSTACSRPFPCRAEAAVTVALTGRTVLLAALGALLVGLGFPSPWGLAAVVGVLLAGVVADLALAASVRGLVLTRSGDRTVRLGGTARVELVVRNPGPRTLRGVLRDAWPPSAGAAPARHRLLVPAGEQRRLAVTLRPTRRGDRRASHVTVRSLGPLGLAARQRTHEVAWTVRVLPPFASRKHLPARLARLRDLDGRTAVLRRGQGTEFDSLREYVIAYDRMVRAGVAGVGVTELLPALVNAMAPLQPELVETDVRGMISEVLARAPRRSLVVLFTGLDAAAVEEGLLPALPSLLRRHEVVVAAVADPRGAEMAAGRGASDAVYDAAAAERARAERGGVARMLGRRGVMVIDATPERLAPAVADAYLALKAAGR